MLRIFFTISLLLLPGAVLGQAKKPNVLWITCEDIGPHLGCYGDTYARTPNLDALAKKSLRYKRVWSNAPVCAPARTTIITGMYATTTGSMHMRSMVKLPPEISLFPVYLRRLGYYCTNHIKEDYNVAKEGKVWDASSPKAHYKNRAKDQPFFAVFNILVTHESQIRKKPHKLIHDPALAPLPTYHPDTPESRHDWAQYYDNITTMDEAVGQLLAELAAAGLSEDTIVIFFSDHGSGMPRNKRTPLNCGLHVPMLVHIPERYRDLAPADYQPGGTTDRLVSFVDLAPTMLSIAGEKPQEFMQGKAFLGRHQAAEPKHLFGYRGRMDERYDLVRSVTDGRYVYVRNFMPHRIAGQHVDYMFETPTTQVWKKLFDQGKLNAVQSQFWLPRPAEELYELRTDPHEVLNLFASKEHDAIRAQLRSVLKNQLLETRDLGFLPEDELHTRSKDSNPTMMGREEAKYPLATVLSTAWEMTEDVKTPIPADRLEASLKHADGAVRYWTAVGLHSRGEQIVRAHGKQLSELLQDPAPSVRIIAAEALGVYGDTDQQRQALATLKSLISLDKNSIYVSLQALNALDAMGARAEPLWSYVPSAAKTDAQIEPRAQGMAGRLIESIRAHRDK